MEQGLFMEKSTGKRGRFFLKNVVTNAREFGQLTETLKYKIVDKNPNIRKI